jgi:hypothetical protein
MRRGLWVVALLCFALMLAGQVLAAAPGAEWSKQAFENKMAAAKEMRFTGTVVSHDPICHCVVVKTAKEELTLQDQYARFMQEYNEAQGIRIGASVQGTYKRVDHVNYLTWIRYMEQ